MSESDVQVCWFLAALGIMGAAVTAASLAWPGDGDEAGIFVRQVAQTPSIRATMPLVLWNLGIEGTSTR